MSDLVASNTAQLATLTIEKARRTSRAPSTWRRYQSAWRSFADYCREHCTEAMPAAPATVCAYLAHYAQTHSWSSVALARCAIAKAHRVAEQADPTDSADVRDVLEAIARTIGTAPMRRAKALTREEIVSILDSVRGCDLRSTRDRALIAVWWLSSCRSAEMSALDLRDLETRDQGIVLHIRRSKTDQRGAGHEIAIPEGDATQALRAWVEMLAQFGQTSGPVWRLVDGSGRRLSPTALADIISRRAAVAGVEGVTGHSVRAGHVTEAAKQGVPLHVIAQQTGHKRIDTVMRYVRRGKMFDETSAKGLL